MCCQINGNKLVSVIKDIRTWVCALASTFPCLLIGKQPKEKRVSKRRINFLVAFPIGAILAIKRMRFKCEDKRVNNV
jgi:hypothetical protein